MIIIAFSKHTSKILPRIFCCRFRHCAPIVQIGKKLVMYQFVNPRNITKIDLRVHDIAILRAHGWHFVYIPIDTDADFSNTSAYSCVDLSKRALRIHNAFIQTPNSLYKYITHK